MAGNGFGCRVDDLEIMGRSRIDPSAVNVEFPIIAHDNILPKLISRSLAQQHGLM
jgi:hypothetical protein